MQGPLGEERPILDEAIKNAINHANASNELTRVRELLNKAHVVNAETESGATILRRVAGANADRLSIAIGALADIARLCDGLAKTIAIKAISSIGPL